MADGVELNAGTGGATAATDDCGAAGHAQIVKLAISTDGSATPIPAEATNGLDVDVTRVIPGTSATHLGKAEDAAHSSGDVGVMALTVRQDTAAALGGTDGDYQPLITDASGRLHVAGPVTDGGGSLTVDGAVTANAGTNLNTSALALEAGGNLAAAATSLAAMDDWDESDRAKVNLIAGQAGITAGAGAVGASTPRVTLASDDPAVVALQIIDNLVLAEDAAHSSGDPGVLAFAVRRDADTSLVGTDGDNAPLQVNAAGSLKVAITSGAGSGGTSIADGATFTRDTTSVTLAAAAVESSAPTLNDGDAAALSMTTGGALRVAVAAGGVAGIAEDSAAAGGEEGVMVLAVRRDAASSGVGADGDFAALSVTSDGSLRVSGGGGGTEYTEDAAAAANPVGNALIVVRDDARGGSLTTTDGDNVALRGTNAGELYVKHVDALTVASHAVTNAGTFAVQATLAAGATTIAKAEDAAHSSSDVGSFVLGVRQDTATQLAGTDGDYCPLIMDSTGRLHVNVSNTLTVASHAVTNAGTFAVQAATAGIAADDAGASGNPVLAAGFSIQTDGTDPGVVSAEGDVATLRTDMQRNLLVNITHPRLFNVSADYGSAQTNTSVQAAPGAGLKLYITDLIISNGATAGNITLLDGSGGTVKFEIYPAINGGVAHQFRNPIVLTANTALCITSTTVTTHSINVSGYIAP